MGSASTEQEVGRCVAVDNVPPVVQEERGKGHMRIHDRLQCTAHRQQLGRIESTLGVRRSKTCRKHQLISFAERNLQMACKTLEHVARRLRPPRLEVAQMAC